MATVRIYKVAELLGLSSQDAMALLKKETGIEVKSASSSVEEIVARQFVEKQAKARKIQLPPPSKMFEDTATAPKKATGKTGAKAPEPPKPAAPVLRPRLIKTAKPAADQMGDAHEHHDPDHHEHEHHDEHEAHDGLGGHDAHDHEAHDQHEGTEHELDAQHDEAQADVDATHEPAVDEPVVEAAPPVELDAPDESTDVDAPGAEAAPEPVTPAAATATSPVTPAAPAPPSRPAIQRSGGLRVESTPPPPLKPRITEVPVQQKPTVHAKATGTLAPKPPAAPPQAPAAKVATPAAPSKLTPATPSKLAPTLRPMTPPAPVAPPVPPRASRVVPPMRRLRIEDPVTGEAPAARPAPPRPILRAPIPPTTPRPPQAATGNLARPGGPGAPMNRPGAPGSRPPLGGPRPLPSQPVRPGMPGAPRPGMPGQRPGGGQFRPPMGLRSRGPRRDDRPSYTPQIEAPPPITRIITLAEGMTVKDLADKLEVKPKDVMKKLMDRRMIMTINTTLDADTAQMISLAFGAEVLMRSFEEELTEVETEASKPEDLIERAPVVTVMGHVDHGKTSLLDAIRSAKVADKEAGGITQHIGAYSVQVGNNNDKNERRVVFLDTPGHEAFTMMRARGAKVTDIVVLVVAADDGVMPQTKEAIDHAKAANVPIVVAINKCDKPDANPERVKRELAELGLQPESWGGTTVMVEVSARQKTNIDQLLEMILLVADIGVFKANPKRLASGTVIESKLDKGRGPVAHVLVQDGTLKDGDIFI
ncbi:MAG: translation initiation factor IF-2, partial [Acidobacteria bacterium]|nr:translation initiation factor IF-2 [Acidobacteriota bacterium]